MIVLGKGHGDAHPCMPQVCTEAPLPPPSSSLRRQHEVFNTKGHKQRATAATSGRETTTTRGGTPPQGWRDIQGRSEREESVGQACARTLCGQGRKPPEVCPQSHVHVTRFVPKPEGQVNSTVRVHTAATSAQRTQ